MTTPAYKKEIRFDAETNDYALYLDSECIGYSRTYHEGEIALSKLVISMLEHRTYTTDELDAIDAGLIGDCGLHTTEPAPAPYRCEVCQQVECEHESARRDGLGGKRAGHVRWASSSSMEGFAQEAAPL